VRKDIREKITGTTPDRPQLARLMKALIPSDMVITPAVDRLSRDTTDLLVIAREMQRAGAGIRSLAEPFLDTTSDFAEIILRSLVSPRSSNAAASWNVPRAAGLTRRRTASNSAASQSSPRTSKKRPASASKLARLSAASRAATMSIRVRFHA
jgi:Resolvase, N terminal domain